jgi:hypothetical protein
MSKINELDQYLGRDHTADYWADEAILYVCELIRGLWETLA